MALSSALCSAVASVLIQRGLRRSNFYAGFWINILVGMIGLWSAVLVLVPYSDYNWRAVPYFVFSGVVGTTGGRFFRVVSIQKVGASVASAIGNLAPFISSGLAIVVLGEHVTLPILAGTMVIVVGTILLSLSGRQGGIPCPPSRLSVPRGLLLRRGRHRAQAGPGLRGAALRLRHEHHGGHDRGDGVCRRHGQRTGAQM